MELNSTGKILPFTKMLRIMKMTAFLLILGIVQVSANNSATAQVTLKEKSASLDRVLKAIKKQSNFDLFFDENLVRAKGKPVEVNVENVPVQAALQEVFRSQDFLTYTLVGKVITVKEKNVVPPVFTTPEILYPQPPPGLDVTISVTNADGQPLEGASVVIKGQSKGVTTDNNGYALIKGIDKDATIIISYTGYLQQEIKINNRKSISVRLAVYRNELDEIQTIAYGKTSKRFSTSNIGTIKSEDIANQPVNNIMTALAGRVPGLFIQQTGGLAGSNVNVVVQGLNSMTQGNAPLYIVDGVPYNPEQITSPVLPSIFNSGGNGRSTLHFINPADIESVEFLKDADATAIYGSRAANGAILITTKSGKPGKTKVDLSYQTGWSQITRKVALMNTQQYIEMRKEYIANNGGTPSATDYDVNGTWDQNKYTDWQDVFIGGTGRYTNLQSNISGGNANTQFLLGVGYMTETTVMPTDFGDRKANLHFNLNHKSENKKFAISLNTTYVYDVNDLPTRDLTSQTIIAPNAPDLYNADGSLNWAPLASNPASSTFSNPMAEMQKRYTAKTNNLIANSNISYDILKGLQIRTSIGFNRTQSEENTLQPQSAYSPAVVANLRSNAWSNKFQNTFIIEPQLNYVRDFKFGHLDVLAGATYQTSQQSMHAFAATGMTTDALLQNIRAATTISASGAVESMYKYNAAFGRINYRYHDKYILNLTARRDGSSRFGSENLFNNFYSAATAWIFTEENFIKKNLPFVSYGKIKASYGTTGNDNIGDYQYLSLYNSVTNTVAYQGAVGLGPAGHANPYLQWEETRKLNFGLDLGFFQNKLLLNVNYFRNRSSNQLLFDPLPVFTGFPNITENLAATVQNSGWEFLIDASPITGKGINWKISANVTIPRNKLISFPGLEKSTLASRYKIGMPINMQQGYVLLGVNPQSGLFQFQKGDGSTTTSPTVATDRNGLFLLDPKYYGGITNTISWGNWDLDILFQGAKQIGPNFLWTGLPGSINVNQPLSILDRWKNVGDVAPYARLGSSSLLSYLAYASVTQIRYTDASYIRLKNVSLSYKLPLSWIKRAGLTGARIALQGQNLITITNYIGRDPESMSTLNMPPLKVYAFALQLNF